MKSSLVRFFVLLPVPLILASSCKKKEDDEIVLPPPLTRQFQLQYTDNMTENVSFASLNENESPFSFSWADAKVKADKIHFGFIVSGNIAGLMSPKDPFTAFFYQGPNGVDTWNTKLNTVFDGEAVPNINFDALTQADIEAGVPDSGFGGNFSLSNISIQKDQIIRFIQKDANDVLRYKGYLRIQDLNLNINPKAVVVQVKYIKK